MGKHAIEAVSDFVVAAGHLRPKTVIIPGGDREEDIRLVESARDHGIIDRCILVGDEAGVRHAARETGVALRSEDIVATTSQEETAAQTVALIQRGGVDVILKGNISTPILNRAMMRILARPTVSLVTVFDTATVAGGRPMLLTDPGVTTICSYGRMVGLIRNAIDVAHAILDLERPRVALLAANEKLIPSLPSTYMAAALTRRRWDDAVVYGPLSFDLAVDPESVALKGMPDSSAARDVAGQADILVCPCLDAANILYKMIMENVKYGVGTFAGITVGVNVPYAILSRADDVETKLQSIALCSIAAERMDMSSADVGLSPVGPEDGMDDLSASLRAQVERGASKMGVPASQAVLVVADVGETVTVSAVAKGKLVDVVTFALGGQWAEGGGAADRAYEVAKAIGAMCVAAGVGVDAVVLTGPFARSRPVADTVKQRVAHMAPILAVDASRVP